MTITEKQAWLWRYRNARPKQEALEARLRTLTAEQALLPRQQRREDSLRRVQEQLNRMERERREIVAAIRDLEDERLQAVLEYHYLRGWPWSYVARRMGYCERHIYTLHRKALEQLVCKGRVRQYHLPTGVCRMACMQRPEVCA